MRSLLLVSLALLLLGCPSDHGEDKSRSGPPKTSTGTANPQEVPENSTAMNPVLPPQTRPSTASPAVEVQLTDYAINIPSWLPRGMQTLRIINGGKENHSFAISGNGVAQQLSQELTRGDTAQMAVNLVPGTYTVYCPVDAHRGKGMQRTISVP